jgi:SpoVK/Ycf46/Vps4 family AAA+-type ATPase
MKPPKVTAPRIDRILPRVTWHDAGLSKDAVKHLRDFCARARQPGKAQAKGAGSRRRIAGGKAIICLLVGFGKSQARAAAEAIATELRAALFRVELSDVVSKFIGETEKNLSTIFAAAEKNNAVLFFDEADALFGKRSEVKDSHDRFANLKTNFLLQRIEEYGRPVILAMNRRRRIDFVLPSAVCVIRP